MSHYGDEFQRLSKYSPDTLPREPLDWSRQPEPCKHYPEAAFIPLPPVPQVQDHSLSELLRRRRSIRDYRNRALSLESLSYLLWAANGVTLKTRGYALRTAPSAGALYPVETYLVANNIAELERGLYHYGVFEHGLHLLRQDDLRCIVANAALGQRMCADAAAVFIWTGVFPRSKWKYRQRAYRYVYLDAGHIAQNLALACENLELGSCQIAALFDDRINDLLQVDGIDESVLYMSTAGYPAR